MPRGIPNAKVAALASQSIQQNTLVPKGAKFYPGTNTPLPEGVTVRSSKGVQIDFMYQGKRCTETLGGKPTVAHVLAAADKRQRVQQLIGLGKFDYAQEFPDSQRVPSATAEVEIKPVQLLGEAMDEWLVNRIGTVGPNAFKDYTKDINLLKTIPLSAFSNPTLPLDKRRGGYLYELPVNELTTSGINYFRQWLLAKPVKLKRVQNVLIPLRGTMAHLYGENVIPRDPFDKVLPLVDDQAKVKKDVVDKHAFLTRPVSLSGIALENEDEAPDPFSPEEVSAILDQLSGSFFNQIVFWVWTGLRTGELIGLKWTDVDLPNNRIYVQRSFSRGILTLPKFRRKRYVSLLPPALATLKAQFEITGQQGPWVFPNPWTGRHWANSSKIVKRFSKACELAGVRYRRPYQCRHTYASTLLSAGENHLYVAQQMGHKDWSMITRVYGRWIKQVDNLAGQRVAALLEAPWSTLQTLIAERQAAAPALSDENAVDDEAMASDDEGITEG